MDKVVFSPINSTVFVSDNMHTRPLAHRDSALVHTNAESISVGCYPEVSGSNEFTLGRAKDVAPGFEPAFDGMIETPGRKLMITIPLSTPFNTC